MDKEPNMVALTKADNAELETNKKIFMNNNNIQYKSKLNPLAKNFWMTTQTNILKENHAMDFNQTPYNDKNILRLLRYLQKFYFFFSKYIFH